MFPTKDTKTNKQTNQNLYQTQKRENQEQGREKQDRKWEIDNSKLVASNTMKKGAGADHSD